MNLLFITVFLYLGCNRIEGIFPLNFYIPSPGLYPWDAFIFSSPDHKYICAGTIINSKAVLTAAHCLYDYESMKPKDHSKFEVAVGKNLKLWSVTEAYDQRFKVSKILMRNTFKLNIGNYEDDIAVIYIEGTITENTNVKVVPIVKTTYDILVTHNPASDYISWRDDMSGPLHNISQDTFHFYDRQKCIEKINAGKKSIQFITPDKFCAVLPRGYKIGAGDTGSGLIYSVYSNGSQPSIENDHFVLGIASIKFGPNIIGFTNVTTHYTWIEEQLKEIKKK